MSKQRTELIDPKQFALEIRDHHEACIGSGNDALQHARQAGRLLAELKKSKAIPHGEWTSWVESTFKFTVRTAQHYMQIAEKWSLIEDSQKRTGGSLLALRDARELIAEPKKESPPKPQPSTPATQNQTAQPAATEDAKDEPTVTAEDFYSGDPTPEAWQVPDPKKAVKGFDLAIRKLAEWEKDVIENLIESDEIGTEFLAGNKGDFKTRVSNLRELLQTRKPYCVCPKCKGQRCELCKQSGLVPKRFSEKGSAPAEAVA